MVTITPSESTHFRVILSSEAMQKETHMGKEDEGSAPECTVVKPEPRTPITNVTSMDPLPSVSSMSSLSPILPTESVDVISPNVLTSTPGSQHSDSPSKKKGGSNCLLP